jgi:hypothetical protein
MRSRPTGRSRPLRNLQAGSLSRPNTTRARHAAPSGPIKMGSTNTSRSWIVTTAVSWTGILDSRQYSVHPFNLLLPAVRSVPAGPVITIDRATTDTGERRTFFGRTARHLITRERSSQSDGETLIDGWYIDLDGLPSTRREAVLVALPYRPNAGTTGY